MDCFYSLQSIWYATISSSSKLLNVATLMTLLLQHRSILSATIKSTTLRKLQFSASSWFFIASNTLNVTCWSFTLIVSSHFCTSIRVFPVAKKSLPSIMGTFLSVSKSSTMKSIGKMNLSTFTSTSSNFPSGYA